MKVKSKINFSEFVYTKPFFFSRKVYYFVFLPSACTRGSWFYSDFINTGYHVICGLKIVFRKSNKLICQYEIANIKGSTWDLLEFYDHSILITITVITAMLNYCSSYLPYIYLRISSWDGNSELVHGTEITWGNGEKSIFTSKFKFWLHGQQNRRPGP